MCSWQGFALLGPGVCALCSKQLMATAPLPPSHLKVLRKRNGLGLLFSPAGTFLVDLSESMSTSWLDGSPGSCNGVAAAGAGAGAGIAAAGAGAGSVLHPPSGASLALAARNLAAGAPGSLSADVSAVLPPPNTSSP